jgi:hypothetical protein
MSPSPRIAGTRRRATLLDVKAVKVSGKTAYRADGSLSVVAANGTTVGLQVAELFILRGSTASGDGTVVVVDAPTDNAGATIIDSVVASVHRI